MTGPTKAAPKPLYYAVIDGTDFVDSAAFGADLEKGTSFRNVAEFLAASDTDASRLIDPDHPDFPVWRVKASGKTAVADPRGIAVFGPGGLNGYARGPGELAFGNDTGRVEAVRALTESWIFAPAVSVDGGKAVLGDSGSGSVFRAHLLALSSHGWLGGFCKGDLPQGPWFMIGKTANDGQGFHGPVWVILAQCSTLNSSTWPSWAKVLMASSPHVRGILGYEEVAPGAVASTSIGKGFVAQLKAGKPFLDAWKANNASNNWAAIVHKDALKDKLSDLAAIVDGRKPLADVTTSDTVTNYKGFLHSDPKHPGGVDIFLKAPPFNFSLTLARSATGRRWKPVEPWNLDQTDARLLPNYKGNAKGAITDLVYEVQLGLSGGQRIKQAQIEWIHVRPTKIRLNMAKIFAPATASVPAKITATGAGKATTVVVLEAPRDSVTITFPTLAEEDMGGAIMAPQTYHGDDKLVPHHSYLWLRITVTPETGAALSCDFPTKGLSWFGPLSNDSRYI